MRSSLSTRCNWSGLVRTGKSPDAAWESHLTRSWSAEWARWTGARGQTSSYNLRPWSPDASRTRTFTSSGQGVTLPDRLGEGCSWTPDGSASETASNSSDPWSSRRQLFAAMDVFALTSREDPFPLVMLEAAAAGVPLVCFAGGGGAPEFAHPDAGRVAAYLDVAGMAAAVSDLLEREEERQRMGQIAAERVRKRHTVDQAGPVLVDVIRRSLGPEWGAASPHG